KSNSSIGWVERPRGFNCAILGVGFLAPIHCSAIESAHRRAAPYTAPQSPRIAQEIHGPPGQTPPEHGCPHRSRQQPARAPGSEPRSPTSCPPSRQDIADLRKRRPPLPSRPAPPPPRKSPLLPESGHVPSAVRETAPAQAWMRPPGRAYKTPPSCSVEGFGRSVPPPPVAAPAGSERAPRIVPLRLEGQRRAFMPPFHRLLPASGPGAQAAICEFMPHQARTPYAAVSSST